MISTLIYRSRAACQLSNAEIQSLTRECCCKNEQQSITGLLLFDGSHFLQVLEGPEPAVRSLFARLQDDPRHGEVHLLLDVPLAERAFPGWHMHLIDIRGSDCTPMSLELPAGVDPRVRDLLEAFQQGRWAVTASDRRGPAPAGSCLDEAVSRDEVCGAASESRPTILIVDDSPDMLQRLSRLLSDPYRVKTAGGGEQALRLALVEPVPDLILLGSMLPGMTGEQVLVALKANAASQDIPVICLTATSDLADEERSLQLGAVDSIRKPVHPMILLARVRTQLLIKAAVDQQRQRARLLEEEVARRTREIQDTQEVTILAMASLAEARDSETGNHILRTQHYVKLLAQHLRSHPKFAEVLTDHFIDLLFKSAPLHDIGKVGIPDRILLKPGRFTPAEFEIMKTHTTLGRDAIQSAEDSLGKSVEFLSVAKEIAYSHQEKWDGSGYPCGLAGEAIPLSARLMAVADVYDALISRRAYKPPMPHHKAVAIIEAGRGSHFDPEIADAFIDLAEEFHRVAQRFADAREDLERQPSSRQQRQVGVEAAAL